MAEYGRVGSASDYAKNEEFQTNQHRPGFSTGKLTETSIGMQTSILKVRESKVTTIDFGEGPFKVEQFQELARLLKDFPPGARVSIEQQAWDDGETFKVTVNL